MFVKPRGNRDGESLDLKDVMEFEKNIKMNNLTKKNKILLLINPREVQELKLTLRYIKKILKNTLLNGIPRVYFTKSSVERIKIKNNIILFYRDHIVKLFNSNDGLNRHIKGITLFNKVTDGNIIINKPLSHGDTSFPFIKEKIIEDDKLILPYSLSDYEINDIANFHFNKVSFSKKIFESEEQKIIRRFLNKNNIKISFSDEILDSGIVHLIGPIHGDFSSGNVIYNNKLVLIDWESYREEEISIDLKKIFSWVNDQSARDLIKEYNGRLKNVGGDVNIEKQIISSQFTSIVNLRTNMFQYFLNLTNGDEKKATKKINISTQNLVDKLKNFIQLI